MSDRKVKRLTPNSIANLVMADEAWHDSLYVRAEDYDSLLADFEALRAALAAPRPEPEKRHPGYIIGNHWLETAYERLCAGEAEDAILEDYEVVREPRLRDLRRDAEKWRSFVAAATELRRLYTEIERLKAENERLRGLLLDIRNDAQTSHWHRDINEALQEPPR